MLSIGQIYLQKSEEQVRMCADLSLNGRGMTLWFGVDPSQQRYLCDTRSDAFVMALLPTAMRGGYDIVCHTPISSRLKYQLEYYLIPALTAKGDWYHPIKIQAPMEDKPVPNAGGVGLGFSGGVDCSYSLMTHGADSAYPVTHLAVFNLGVFEGETAGSSFRNACKNTGVFAREQGLELVGLDSNINDVLPERYLDVYSFRNLSGALALQGLFSVYLLSSGHDSAGFALDVHNAARFDLLTVHCAQTESMKVYLSGSQIKRCDKLVALADWEPAQKWLHPCFHTGIGKKNCGRCHKCAWDLIVLYALGKLDCFRQVFDVETFRRELPVRLGFILSKREDRLSNEAIQFLESRGVPIPEAAYVYAEQFSKANQRLKQS